MMKTLTILLGLAMLLMGCATKPLVEPEPASPLFVIPQKPATGSVTETADSLQADSNDNLAILDANKLDLTGAPSHYDWSEEQAVTSIKMAVLSCGDDGSRYWAIIKFTNDNKEDVTANLHLYAYDKIGRLVRTEFEGSVYFRQGSIMTKQYSFTKRGREVRWLLNLTGRRK